MKNLLLLLLFIPTLLFSQPSFFKSVAFQGTVESDVGDTTIVNIDDNFLQSAGINLWQVTFCDSSVQVLGYHATSQLGEDPIGFSDNVNFDFKISVAFGKDMTLDEYRGPTARILVLKSPERIEGVSIISSYGIIILTNELK